MGRIMNRTFKLLLDAFVFGSAIGGMLTWVYTIGVAKQADWLVVMDFNLYGEGMLEYIYMGVWLAVTTAYGVYWFYNVLKKEGVIYDL